MTAQEIKAVLDGCVFEYIGLRVDDGASYQPRARTTAAAFRRRFTV